MRSEKQGKYQYSSEKMGLTEYDPIQIVEKTQGRMAEDAQWLKITRL